MSWKIPLFKSYNDEDDINSVNKVIRRGTYWAAGPEINEFEENIKKFIGTKYALVFNSGTSALHSLFLACEIGKGDEVIVPSFTFIATANTPLFVGAKPVFADIERKTYALDPEDVKNKITKKTKAIMPIHYGGCPALYIEALKEIAEDHKILLIEDAAQSMGSKIKDEKTGTFGDAAMFSLCQDKMITTGEGGIIVTNSKEYYEHMKLIRSHGRAESSNYFSSTDLMDYVSIGYNFRMPTIIAALGNSQLNKINKTISIRQENAEKYTNKLSKVKDIFTPFIPENYFHVYQKYTIQMKDLHRDKLMEFLKNKGVFTKAYFGLPVHLTKFYRQKFGYEEGMLPETEYLAKRVLTLPMFPDLKEEEIIYITDSIKEYFEG